MQPASSRIPTLANAYAERLLWLNGPDWTRRRWANHVFVYGNAWKTSQTHKYSARLLLPTMQQFHHHPVPLTSNSLIRSRRKHCWNEEQVRNTPQDIPFCIWNVLTSPSPISVKLLNVVVQQVSHCTNISSICKSFLLLCFYLSYGCMILMMGWRGCASYCFILTLTTGWRCCVLSSVELGLAEFWQYWLVVGIEVVGFWRLWSKFANGDNKLRWLLGMDWLLAWIWRWRNISVK